MSDEAKGYARAIDDVRIMLETSATMDRDSKQRDAMFAVARELAEWTEERVAIALARGESPMAQLFITCGVIAARRMFPDELIPDPKMTRGGSA